MSKRLIRALRTGGSAHPVEGDRWAVRRGYDRRGRVIGHLPHANIHSLFCESKLKPLDAAACRVWVWSGPRQERDFQNHESAGVSAVLLGLAASEAYLAEAILYMQPGRRGAIISSVEAFQQDHNWLNPHTRPSRMDWPGADNSARLCRQVCQSRRGEVAISGDARQRFAALRDMLSIESWQLLLRLVVHAWSRKDFIRQTGMAVSQLNQEVLRVLLALDKVYRLEGDQNAAAAS